MNKVLDSDIRHGILNRPFLTERLYRALIYAADFLDVQDVHFVYWYR